MAIDPSVRIDIAAQFTGKKAFDKAGLSTKKLDSAVAGLAKRFAVAFSATAVLNFGKAAVKAFAEDEKSASILANTMKNLGLEFQNPAVEDFISKLSAATGELDDNLRPAMQKLLQVTGSVSKSQKLLALALDVAAGSGQSLDTVVADLAAAQAGNTRGLRKYALGLTAAELKTISFEDVVDKLGTTFEGSAATAAETFSGQLKILTTAAGEAQETIGKGLVDAFRILSGESGGVVKATEQMAKLAQSVADVTVGFAMLIKKLKDIPTAGKGVELFAENLKELFMATHVALIPIIKVLEVLGKLGRQKTGTFQVGMSVTGATDYYAKQLDAIEKAEKDAEARRLAAIKAAAATKAKLDKANAAKTEKLAKAAAMFDMEKIQVAAALKGKITAEEKLRLELQQAILDQNDEQADKLQKKLEASQIATAKLAAQIVGIKPPVDPFKQTLDTLESIAALLGRIAGITFNPSQNKDRNYDALLGASAGAGLMPGAGGGVAGNGGGGAGSTTAVVPEIPSYVPSSFYDLENMFPYIPKMSSTPSSAANITVNVDAGAVVMQDDLVTIINDAVISAQKNGYTQLPNGAIVG